MSKTIEEIRQKHGPAQTIDPTLAAQIKGRQENGNLTCSKAHAIAKALDTTPAQVGKAMDILGIRISRCQMGLFGYSPEKKAVKPTETVDAAIKTELESAVNDNRIPCARCWELADRHKIPRMAVAAACEALGYKISRCQLGAF